MLICESRVAYRFNHPQFKILIMSISLSVLGNMWEWAETPSREKKEKLDELNRQYPLINKTLGLIVAVWAVGCFSLTVSIYVLMFHWEIIDFSSVIYAYFCCLYGLSILIWIAEYRNIHREYYEKVYDIIGTPPFLRQRKGMYLMFVCLAILTYAFIVF